jgi:hypothetical protein
MVMNRVGATSTKAAVCAALLFGALHARPAAADVSIARSDTWEVFTTGRVGGFFTYGWGDANPIADPGDPNAVPPIPPEDIPPGGGLSVGVDGMPRLAPDGVTHIQGTFRSMRVRSGFVPNILALGFRRHINDSTTLKAYISLWATIESDGQRKTNPITTDAREGYLKVEGPWGSFLAGRALSLFSRGATENDFLYLHGYGVGYPGNIDSLGPTPGLINFGVLAAFFSPGLVYATPTAAGLQLSVGVYDPTPLQGTYEGTRWARPEAELTYDLQRGSFKLHLFANGEFQKVYRPSSNESATSYGIGAGGRAEIGPLHIGIAGHRGPGLGIGYALEPGSTSVSNNFQLRTCDGGSVIVQFSQPRFDLNAGVGISRVFQLQEDADNRVSPLKRQIGVALAVVWHITDYLHYDIDALHGDAAWYLGEKQQFTFVSTGMTATW